MDVGHHYHWRKMFELDAGHLNHWTRLFELGAKRFNHYKRQLEVDTERLNHAVESGLRTSYPLDEENDRTTSIIKDGIEDNVWKRFEMKLMEGTPCLPVHNREKYNFCKGGVLIAL